MMTDYKAETGVAFDPDNPEFQNGDALRYATLIQIERDKKNYAEADKLRERVRAWGMTVSLGKNFTIVSVKNLKKGSFVNVVGGPGFITEVNLIGH